MTGLVVALVGALVLALLAGGGLWLSRTHTLGHRVGSFRCASGRTEGGPWYAGVAQYGSERLYWWRRWSLAPRPGHRWDRAGFAIVARELHDLQLPGTRVLRVTCEAGGQRIWLLMSPEAYAGLTSWIEATPSRVSRVV
ncbi:DUF2550 family protein [Cellulomonas alba]|uniref:DUF2550 family protein n=1 Tax=Cellulomonas alba TaxID=3053467 RepID=A0ABT7SHW7_9CELL|nr:DUF2550 family protein [Cellulomonas alba]MDM7855771.1 DUF2550 family protein [Cellulomonas alba]